MIRDLLPKFSVGLSPMDEVTTKEYREICKSYGADVLYTEFVASDALIRDVEKSYKKIDFTEKQRPIAIQIFGNTEQSLIDAAQKVESLAPDWIDINWGCPMKRIAGKGSGSGILIEPDKMIYLTKKIVNSVHLPVSVKTRIAYDYTTKKISEFAEKLQDTGIQLLAIHGRTKQQMYKGEANWEEIKCVKENPRIHIPIFGNGDINSAKKLLEYKQKYLVDGILIGRAAVGNPFLFRQCKEILENKTPYTPSLEEKITICKKHLNMAVENHGERRAIITMKKFYSRYFIGIQGFKPYKMQLLEAQTVLEIEQILTRFYYSVSSK